MKYLITLSLFFISLSLEISSSQNQGYNYTENFYYIVKREDTITNISEKHGITVEELVTINNLDLTKDRIYVGQKLLIPKTGNSSYHNYPATSTINSPPMSSQNYHVVKRGETLSSISRRYGTSIGEITRINSLSSPNNIVIGQRLMIPGSNAIQSNYPPASETNMYYTVKRGDTLYKISKSYGVSLESLLQINHIDNPNIISIGQEITIPRTNAAYQNNNNYAKNTEYPKTSQQNNLPTEHIIQKGDTLSRISRKYGVSIDDIVRTNEMVSQSDTLYVGSSLEIPGNSQNSPSIANNPNPNYGYQQPGPKAQSSQPPQAYANPHQQGFQTQNKGNYPYYQTHIVDKGETLQTISHEYNSNPYEIMKANNISPNQEIFIGQELFIPVSSS